MCLCLRTACVSCLSLLCVFLLVSLRFQCLFLYAKVSTFVRIVWIRLAEVLYDSCVCSGYTSVQFSLFVCLFTFEMCKWIRLKWIWELCARIYIEIAIQIVLWIIYPIPSVSRHTQRLRLNKNIKNIPIKGILYLILVNWSIYLMMWSNQLWNSLIQKTLQFNRITHALRQCQAVSFP